MSPQNPPSSSTAATSSTFARGRRRAAAAFAVASLGLLVAGFVGTTSAANALGAPVGLGTAASYAVLAGSTVTNTGPSVMHGNLGVSPGSAVQGFPPGRVVPPGVIHKGDAPASRAKKDLTTAYKDAAGRPSTSDQTGKDLGGQTLTTGVYTASTSMALTGDVTLDAQGDPTAVFVFQAGSTLITASSSRVLLINGASPCNVFWQVGSSATLGTGSTFAGTILALTSATLTTGAKVEGRVLARNGAVTLDHNVIDASRCAPKATSTPTKKPTKHHTKHLTSTVQTPSTPVTPTGHPSTGVGGEARATGGPGGPRGTGSTALFALAGLAGLAALIAALLASEPRAIRRHR